VKIISGLVVFRGSRDGVTSPNPRARLSIFSITTRVVGCCFRHAVSGHRRVADFCEHVVALINLPKVVVLVISRGTGTRQMKNCETGRVRIGVSRAIELRRVPCG